MSTPKLLFVKKVNSINRSYQYCIATKKYILSLICPGPLQTPYYTRGIVIWMEKDPYWKFFKGKPVLIFSGADIHLPVVSTLF